MKDILPNLGTVAVCIAVAAIAVLALIGLYRDKKAGKSSCGCSCGSCPMSSSCHKAAENNEKKEKQGSELL